jgi:DNA helicase HerA-like ATPase
LTESTGDWLEEFQTKNIVNVFIGHLSQRDRNLVVGATARMLQMLRKASKVPPFVFILDEAHFFLPAGGELTPSTSVIRELIRTARHDAIGIIIVTQSPSSMDRQVLLTCNTRLVFALDKDDFRVVAGTMGDLPEEIINRIPKLPQGQAVISSGLDIMRHSSIIKIRTRETREGAPTPNLAYEVKIWRRKNNR